MKSLVVSFYCLEGICNINDLFFRNVKQIYYNKIMVYIIGYFFFIVIYILQYLKLYYYNLKVSFLKVLYLVVFWIKNLLNRYLKGKIGYVKKSIYL